MYTTNKIRLNSQSFDGLFLKRVITLSDKALIWYIVVHSDFCLNWASNVNKFY